MELELVETLEVLIALRVEVGSFEGILNLLRVSLLNAKEEEQV